MGTSFMQVISLYGWQLVNNGNKFHINTPIFPDNRKFVPLYSKYNQKSTTSCEIF